jgi:hypothetical protein
VRRDIQDGELLPVWGKKDGNRSGVLIHPFTVAIKMASEAGHVFVA